MTLILKGTDNSVSDPAVQGGTGGATTGVYYPASNQVALATNGTVGLLQDASQNIGIGVTPSGWDTAVRRGLQLGLGGVYESDTRSAYLGNTSIGGNFYYNGGWKYIGTDYASKIEFQNDSGNQGTVVIAGAASGTAGNPITWSSLLSLKKDNTVALQGGVVVAGTGITFPATQNASTDANTLDDYEEGTWSPTNATFSTFSGVTGKFTYVKIGKVVTVCFKQDSGTIAPGGSARYIVGLPFNPDSNYLGAIGYAGDSGPAQDNGYILPWVGNAIYFQKNFSSTGNLCFSVTYIAV